MPSDAASIRIALTTTGTVEEGQRLARVLVERRLAACVNVIPNLTSVYRWQGAIEEASEVLLLIKTTKEMLGALESFLRENHSYEVPEFLVLDVDSGSQPYLDWLLNSVAQ